MLIRKMVSPVRHADMSDMFSSTLLVPNWLQCWTIEQHPSKQERDVAEGRTYRIEANTSGTEDPLVSDVRMARLSIRRSSTTVGCASPVFVYPLCVSTRTCGYNVMCIRCCWRWLCRHLCRHRLVGLIDCNYSACHHKGIDCTVPWDRQWRRDIDLDCPTVSGVVEGGYAWHLTCVAPG
jgi:hypothetical protein